MFRLRFLACFCLTVSLTHSASAQLFQLDADTYVGHESGDGSWSTLDIEVKRYGSTDRPTRVEIHFMPYGRNVAQGTLTAEEIDLETDYSYFDDLEFAYGHRDVVFEIGESTKTVSINIHDDEWVEGDESFVVALNPAYSYETYTPIGRLSYPRTAVVTIRDDEMPSTAPPLSPPLHLTIESNNTMHLEGTSNSEDYDFYNDFLMIRDWTVSFYAFPISVHPQTNLSLDAGDGDDRIAIDSLAQGRQLHVDGGDGDDELVFRRYSTGDGSTAVLAPGELQYTATGSDWISKLDAEDVESIEVLNAYSFGSIVASLSEVETGTNDNVVYPDVAYLFDSAGDDVLTIDSNNGLLTGDGYKLNVDGFDKTIVYASTGFDTATFRDSVFDDTFIAKPNFARMTGTRPHRYSTTEGAEPYEAYAAGFDEAVGYASLGFDTAHLYDSQGDEIYTGTPGFGELRGSDLFLKAGGFDSVAAYSSGGQDEALLFDSEGDDLFVGRQGISALFAVDREYAHTVKNFSIVEATADAGGLDEAQFYDSVGDDQFFASREAPGLVSNGFRATAVSFQRIRAFSTRGGLDFFEQQIRLPYQLIRSGAWVNY